MSRFFLFLVLLILSPISLVAQNIFFKIKKDRGYQFEIPDSLLDRNILFGSRIIDISEPSAKVYAAGQLRTPPVVIRFVRSGKQLIMQQIVNNFQADTDDPIFKAIEKNQKISAVQTFDIDSRSNSDNSSFIDVTKYFSDEVTLAWPLPDNVKKGRLESKLSAILQMREHSDHINIRCHYGYTGGKEPFSITVQYFMLLLPKEAQKIRYNDERIGYQSINIKRYESGKPIVTKEIICRWRIEPKPEDVKKHRSGILVEPAKPIIVYIEPYFPKDWIPYIKQGIEDWQKAFETIGFKNAIVAKEFPDDADFDPEDIKINCVRYLPLDEANAAGQIWIDPTCGEIIQGDILWWNNVIELIKMWRFTQTAAVDPKARAINYSKEITGEMIRYAIAHETGHMLGLQHNMRSSFAYPVDSLRSASFTQKYGTTASIMDYARNNHVAQVGDLERGVRMTPPVLGPFDKFSVQYGYKIFYDAKNENDELAALDKLFTEKKHDPVFLFAPFIASPIPPDPSGQSESLGDDIVKSSGYGIMNTQIILKNLKKWTLDAGGNDELLLTRYEALSKQYFRYLSLTLSYIGGIYQFPGPFDEKQLKYVQVNKEKQKEALKFVVNELFESHKYLDVKELYGIIPIQKEAILKKQTDIITSLLGNLLLARLNNNELTTEDQYTLSEYFKNLDSLIFDESRCNVLNSYIKNIQTVYIKSLASLSSDTNVLIREAVFEQKRLTAAKLKQLNEKNDLSYYHFLTNLIEN
ncbi:MAG: zinc-dependent metalloprotease [Bacteroidales bacterium]|jgi:hypothetical protein